MNNELGSGKITQQQANQMLSRINKGMPFFGFMGMGRNQSVAGAVYGKRGHWMGSKQSVAGAVYGKRGSRMGRNSGAMGGFMILKPLASALNMTPQTR